MLVVALVGVAVNVAAALLIARAGAVPNVMKPGFHFALAK